MASLGSKSLDTPDETRTPPKTKVEIVRLGDHEVARFTFEPGWKWSDHVKPVAGTESCQVHHVGVVVSGRLHVRHEDGTEAEVGPGDVYEITPSHNGWVLGDEPFVAVEFKGIGDYAKG